MPQRRLPIAVAVAFLLGVFVGGLGTAVLSQPPEQFVELEALRETNRILGELVKEQRRELAAAHKLLEDRSAIEPPQ